MNAIGAAFLAVLTAHGISYATPELAIWDAHQVCANVAMGNDPKAIAMTLVKQTNLDGYHAGFFVGASIAAYCPEWMSGHGHT
jgi:Protein of unknown function (DUF732)